MPKRKMQMAAAQHTRITMNALRMPRTCEIFSSFFTRAAMLGAGAAGLTVALGSLDSILISLFVVVRIILLFVISGYAEVMTLSRCKFTTIFQFRKAMFCKKMLERSRCYPIDMKLDINMLQEYVV